MEVLAAVGCQCQEQTGTRVDRTRHGAYGAFEIGDISGFVDGRRSEGVRSGGLRGGKKVN